MCKRLIANSSIWVMLAITGFFLWSLSNQAQQIDQSSSQIPQGQVEMAQSELTNNVGFIHVNTDTVAQLQALPGIGPALAQRIVDHRTENGPFQTMEELTLVSGIGEKTLAKFAPYVSLETTWEQTYNP